MLLDKIISTHQNYMQGKVVRHVGDIMKGRYGTQYRVPIVI